MKTYKVFFDNGDWLTTGFNGNIEDANRYYLNNWFNLGQGENDLMAKAINVIEIEGL